MTWFAKTLATVAVALVAVAQVVVSPASCCLIREALFGGEACCRVSAATAEPTERSCCHGRPPGEGETPDRHNGPFVPAGNCPWCSASPKVAADDRVVAPQFEPAVAFEPALVIAPASAAFDSCGLVATEPFHRTALAACAWYCTWQI